MGDVQVVPRVIELFELSCKKQIENLGAYIKNTDIDLQRLTTLDGLVSASIEAGSEDLSILMYLSVPGALLRETMPTVDAQNENIYQYQEDWCLELANRLLGDLKNQLLSHHHCILRMGLPKLCQDDILDIEKPVDCEVCDRLFLLDSHLLAQIHNLPVVCRLFVKKINKGMVFAESLSPSEDEDWFEEGELELF